MSAAHPTVAVSIDFTTELANAIGYHEQVQISGPHSYHRLLETSGTFADASGNGKTGTGTGSITYNQTTGNPVSGDPAARYVLLTTDTTRIGFTGAVPTTGALTLEAFIYVTDLSKDRYIFETVSAVAGKIIEFWVETNGALSAQAGNQSTPVVGSAGAIVINTWYHVAVVFDAPAQQVRFYKNGALIHTGAWTAPLLGSPSMSIVDTAWHWGSDSSSGRGAIARLGQPAAYLHAVSLQEFADHYAARLTVPFTDFDYTLIDNEFVMFNEPFGRSFGRASELDDVVAMQLWLTLRNDDRRFEIEYASTLVNLVTNPSLEVDATGWTNVNGATNARTTAAKQFGVASLQVTADGSVVNQGVGFSPVSVTSGLSYIASVWVKGPAGVELYINLFGAAGSSLTDFVCTGDWQRVETPVKVAASTTTVTLYVATRNSGAGQAAIFYVDGAQVEQATEVTAYADGSLPNHTWTGTAHASTSNRGGVFHPYVVPGRPIKIEMTQDAVTYDWAFGYIEDFPQNWDQAGRHCRVPIRASCFLERLNEENIGARDFSEQLAGARLDVLLNAAGHPLGWRDLDAGSNSMMELTADTNTVGAHARAVARSDRGVFFFDPRGYATFHDGAHRTTDARSTASQGTLGGSGIPYSSPDFHAPRDRIRNEIRLRRPGGVDQVVIDQTSRTRYGKRSFSDELMLTSDSAVAGRATTLLAAYKEPHKRVSAVTFNPASGSGYWSHSLGVLPSDRYTWLFQPAQGSSDSEQLFVEGVSDSYTGRVYTSKWFLSVV